jgi:surface protein
MSDKTFIAGHLVVSSDIYNLPQNEWDRWAGVQVTYLLTGEKFHVAFPNEVFDDTGFKITQVTSHAVDDNIHVIMYLQVEPFYDVDPVSAIRFIYPKSGLSVPPPNGDDEYPVFKGDYIPYDKPILESIVSEGYVLPSNLGIYPCAGGVYQLLRDVNDEPRVVTCRYDAKSNLIVTKMNQFDSSMDIQGVADHDTVAHAVHGGYGALPVENDPYEGDLVLAGQTWASINSLPGYTKISVEYDSVLEMNIHQFRYNGTEEEIKIPNGVTHILKWHEGPRSFTIGSEYSNHSGFIFAPEWLPRSVTSTKAMFQGCTNFRSDISQWDVSNVTNMGHMFFGCQAQHSDISRWDVSNVTNMDLMFDSCVYFNQDLSRWCVSKITAPPLYFDYNTPAWTLPKPIWGTCPNG